LNNWMIVDSREPVRFYEYMKKILEKQDYVVIRKALKVGDYETEKVLAERKTIADLIASITSKRWNSQTVRMSQQDDKVRILVVEGSIKEYIEKMKEVGVSTNLQLVYGAIASFISRQAGTVIWVEDEKDAIITLAMLAKKIDEEQFFMPKKRNIDLLTARALGVTKKQLGEVIEKYGTINVTEEQFMQIKGIGTKKAHEARRVLQEVWHV